MRKGSFLMALTTAKRAAELVALLCDDTHFWCEGELIALFHRASPRRTVQVILPLPSTSNHGRRICVCPVETIRLILKERDRLRLQHSAVFFSWTFPHKPLDAAAFECCIRYCLVKAGIQAPPGSTRSVAALAGSSSLEEVLRPGDWTNASTYFRFYHAL
jgi:hypothetical protein